MDYKKMIEEFEKFYAIEWDESCNTYEQSAWKCAWRSSRKFMVITLPSDRIYPTNEAASEADYYFDQGQADGISKSRIAIHAAGVKTK